MASKKELENMRCEMYKTMYSARKGFKDFTPKERVMFVTNAFLQVNKYNCALYGTGINSIMFGFSVGEGFKGSCHGPTSISFSLSNALTTEDPFAVYDTLFHEFKHTKQFSEKGWDYKLGLKYMPIYNKFKGSKLTWAISPLEIVADNSANKQMTKVMQTGLIKSQKKAQPAKDYLKWVGKRAIEYSHADVFVDKLLIHPAKTIKELINFKEAKIAEKSIKNTQYFNLRQILGVMAKNPEPFEKLDIDKINNVCLEYANNNPRPQDRISFFSTYRRYNWNVYGAEQDCLEIQQKLAHLDEEVETIESLSTQTKDTNIENFSESSAKIDKPLGKFDSEEQFYVENIQLKDMKASGNISQEPTE